MIDHILVPLDGSRLAECVLPHVVSLARTFESQVTLLHALAAGRSRSVDPLGWQARKAESDSYLDEIEGMRYEKVLIPLDGSQRAECVLPLASKLAQDQGCRLLFAHVVPKPEVPRREPLTEEEQELIERLTAINRDYGESYLNDLQERLPVDVQPRLLVSEDPAATLHELVEEEEVDLVLLSAHGYTGETSWPYGSIALNFIVYGSSPRLIVQGLSVEEIGQTPAERAASEKKGH